MAAESGEAWPLPTKTGGSHLCHRRVEVVGNAHRIEAQAAAALVGVCRREQPAALWGREVLDRVGDRDRGVLADIAGHGQGEVGQREDGTAHDEALGVEVAAGDGEGRHSIMA